MVYEGGMWSFDRPLDRTCGAWVTVTSDPVIGTDFYTMLAEIAGAELAGVHTLDGARFVPVLQRTGEIQPPDVVWHFPAYLEAFHSVLIPWRTMPASARRRENTS